MTQWFRYMSYSDYYLIHNEVITSHIHVIFHLFYGHVVDCSKNNHATIPLTHEDAGKYMNYYNKPFVSLQRSSLTPLSFLVDIYSDWILDWETSDHRAALQLNLSTFSYLILLDPLSQFFFFFNLSLHGGGISNADPYVQHKYINIFSCCLLKQIWMLCLSSASVVIFPYKLLPKHDRVPFWTKYFDL